MHVVAANLKSGGFTWLSIPLKDPAYDRVGLVSGNNPVRVIFNIIPGP